MLCGLDDGHVALLATCIAGWKVASLFAVIRQDPLTIDSTIKFPVSHRLFVHHSFLALTVYLEMLEVKVHTHRFRQSVDDPSYPAPYQRSPLRHWHHKTDGATGCAKWTFGAKRNSVLFMAASSIFSIITSKAINIVSHEGYEGIVTYVAYISTTGLHMHKCCVIVAHIYSQQSLFTLRCCILLTRIQVTYCNCSLHNSIIQTHY